MFVEEKTQGEVTEAPAKTMKLSEAIRVGKESHHEVWHGWCGCAIGLAHRALHDGENLNDRFDYYRRNGGGTLVETWAKDHGFDPHITKAAEDKHNDGMPALEVAGWLESKGL